MRHEAVERRKARRFAWTLAGLLLVGSLVLRLRGHGGASWWVAATAAAAPLCAFAVPAVWDALFRAWMAFGALLNWIVTRVILVLFFYGVLTPVGLLMRLGGRRPLDLAWPDPKPSFWKERETAPESSLERYEKGF